jgi:hypothetical protein
MKPNNLPTEDIWYEMNECKLMINGMKTPLTMFIDLYPILKHLLVWDMQLQKTIRDCFILFNFDILVLLTKQTILIEVKTVLFHWSKNSFIPQLIHFLINTLWLTICHISGLFCKNKLEIIYTRNVIVIWQKRREKGQKSGHWLSPLKKPSIYLPNLLEGWLCSCDKLPVHF